MKDKLAIRDAMILTAGPSISQKEIDYVLDAVKTGWNFHWSDYLRKFEKALAAYEGTEHALAVSHGTAALHLALAVFGVGPGDEVIVPDLTYVACSNVVRYLGAKPVFADVDRETWCLDPKSVEKLITSKTKAIMPVWMYGNAPDMDAIMAIAKKHKLYVIEDSCPALGTTYKNKKAGSIGDVGAFSFQGAKIAVMGEGGGFVTNRKDFMDQAMSLYDHGRDENRQFWAKQFGYMYELSGVQAALGLAQVERIEELVAKKRQIFKWYFDRLSSIKYFSLNKELPGVCSNMWMPSIVLHKDAPISRDDLRVELKKRMIDTRPFFFPITMFPIYEDKQAAVRNPNAYYLSANGLNLPSGFERTEEDVDYIASHIKDILGV